MVNNQISIEIQYNFNLFYRGNPHDEQEHDEQEHDEQEHDEQE